MKDWLGNISGKGALRVVVSCMLLLGLISWAIINSGSILVGGKQNLRFWCMFTGPDGVTMLRMIKGFNTDHENAHVTMQRMEAAMYYNKLLVAGLGDRSPEVFVVHITSVPRFEKAGVLEPLNDLFERGEAGLDRADFDENIFHHVVRNDKVLAVPLDIHPMGMYYNPEMMKAAGLVDAQGNVMVPETQEEFLHALRRLKETHTEPGTWPFAWGWLPHDMQNMIAQWGGSFVNEDFTKCTLDDPRNVAAMQFAADLIHKHKLVPPLDSRMSWVGFRQGKLALAFEGVYMLGDLVRVPGLSYEPAVLPQLGPQKGVFANSHVLCVRAGIEGEQREAALALVKYLSDNSLDWAEAGQVPVRRSLRDTDRFREMKVQEVFSRQIPYAMFLPMVPWLSEMQAEFSVAIERILYGTETPEVALGKATKNVNEVIERYRLMDEELARIAAEEAAEESGGAQ